MDDLTGSDIQRMAITVEMGRLTERLDAELEAQRNLIDSIVDDLLKLTAEYAQTFSLGVENDI